MASGTKVKKHNCSCGRTFRHAISLKRHQNVTGCGAAPAGGVNPKDEPKDDVAVAVEKQADDRTIVITPELVARWQAQTGFHPQAGSFVDSLEAPASPAPPRIDWTALARTAQAFLVFCGDVRRNFAAAARSGAVVFGRSALFFSVLFLAGWFLVTGVSASDANGGFNDVARTELAAQTLVQDFLQNARLNQYERARQLLAPGARESVTADQLQIMFNSLPLKVAPTAWRTELSSDMRRAQVTVNRAGVEEVYSLVLSHQGWGVASVSVGS